MITYSLCVELDLTVKPPVVADVVVVSWGGFPTYKSRPALGPCAVLAEVSARSRREALGGFLGLIEQDGDLAWVRDWPQIRGEA